MRGWGGRWGAGVFSTLLKQAQHTYPHRRLLPATCRGRRQQGRDVLRMIRGTDEVSAEFEDMCEAADNAAKVSQAQAWRNLAKREYR